VAAAAWLTVTHEVVMRLSLFAGPSVRRLWRRGNMREALHATTWSLLEIHLRSVSLRAAG